MNKTATIRARVEPNLKSEVEDILERLGLSASETIQLLYRQIKLQRGLPFDLRLPNELTTRTLRRSKKGQGVRRFSKKDDLYRDLGL
jgi:DNA-damage-inducible protein J